MKLSVIEGLTEALGPPAEFVLPPCERCGDACGSQLEFVPLDPDDPDAEYEPYYYVDETEGWHWTLCSACDSNLDDPPEHPEEPRKDMFAVIRNVDGREREGA